MATGSKSVFTQSDGVIARVPINFQTEENLVRIKLGDKALSLPVTGFALEMGGNYQFLHTVSDFVYFYAFGDRISQLDITGMAFINRACPGSTDAAARTEENSILDAYELYMARRATNRNEDMKSVPLTLGRMPFWALVTGMRLEIPRADIPIAQWVLRLHVIPRK
jgi:hypothetical protein